MQPGLVEEEVGLWSDGVLMMKKVKVSLNGSVLGFRERVFQKGKEPDYMKVMHQVKGFSEGPVPPIGGYACSAEDLSNLISDWLASLDNEPDYWIVETLGILITVAHPNGIFFPSSSLPLRSWLLLEFSEHVEIYKRVKDGGRDRVNDLSNAMAELSC